MMIVKINGAPILASAQPTDFYTSLSNIGDFFVATKDFFVSIGHFFTWVAGGIANIKELGFWHWALDKVVYASDIAIIVALFSLLLMIFGWKKGRTVTYWSVITYLIIQVFGVIFL